MAKQDDYVRYTIRVPQELYRRVQEAAGEKSVNAEIVARLQWSIDEDVANERANQHFRMLERVGDGTIDADDVADAGRNDGSPAMDDDATNSSVSDDPLLGRSMSRDMAESLEGITATLTTLLNENKLLREEVSALYKQIPKGGQ